MDQTNFHFHSNQARPFFHVAGTPVYLTTILVAVHILAIILSVILPRVIYVGVAFESGRVASGEIWRVASYILCHPISIWMVLDIVFLFFCGRQLEEMFGPKAFGALYALAVLVPALVLWSAYAITKNSYVLQGTHWPHFMLLLSVAFLQPDASFFVSWLKLKWVVLAFFVVEILSYLQSRQYVMVLAYVTTCAVAYIWLRRCGLGPRFTGVLEKLGDFKPRLPERKPKLKVLDGGRPRAVNPSTYYEPKIKPRPELDREHPAVVEIDAVLDKISREGFGSLTDEEKKALDRASAELKDKDKRR
jgi:membrane associated rhomboid family serine protease